MEDLKYPWSAKVPGGHMHLLMTFVIRFNEEDFVSVDGGSFENRSSSEDSIKQAGIKISPEMQEFVSQCDGSVDIRRDFTIHFSNIEDYTRFKLLEFGDWKPYYGSQA